MRYAYLFFLTVFLTAGMNCLAQSPDDTLGVVIHADPRLAILLKKQPWSNVPHGTIRSLRGFRVQIYSGPDRLKANQIKIDFIRRFPDLRSYLTYISPTFRVKVGDFRTRQEAMDLYQEVRHLYPPCMIVPDIVEINTTHEN